MWPGWVEDALSNKFGIKIVNAISNIVRGNGRGKEILLFGFEKSTQTPPAERQQLQPTLEPSDGEPQGQLHGEPQLQTRGNTGHRVSSWVDTGKPCPGIYLKASWVLLHVFKAPRPCRCWSCASWPNTRITAGRCSTRLKILAREICPAPALLQAALVRQIKPTTSATFRSLNLNTSSEFVRQRARLPQDQVLPKVLQDLRPFRVSSPRIA